MNSCLIKYCVPGHIHRITKHIKRAGVFACLLLLSVTGCTAHKYSGWWNSYFPSEFVYSYNLRPDGSCELHYSDQYDEMMYDWVASNCRWTDNMDTLVLVFRGETIYGIETSWTESGGKKEESRKPIDFPPITMTYSIDEFYVNTYLTDLYRCNYKITGILSMVPHEPGSCKKDWCRYPVFRAKNDNVVSIHKQISNNSCK